MLQIVQTDTDREREREIESIVFTFGLPAKMSPKAQEDIFYPPHVKLVHLKL